MLRTYKTTRYTAQYELRLNIVRLRSNYKECWPGVRHAMQSNDCLVAELLSNTILSRFLPSPKGNLTMMVLCVEDMGLKHVVREHRVCCADSSGASGGAVG